MVPEIIILGESSWPWMNEAVVRAIKCGKKKKEKEKALIAHYYVWKKAVTTSQRLLCWAFTAGL